MELEISERVSRIRIPLSGKVSNTMLQKAVAVRVEAAPPFYIWLNYICTCAIWTTILQSSNKVLPGYQRNLAFSLFVPHFLCVL